MDENEFEFCGLTYQAKLVDLQNGCTECDIWTKSHGCAAHMFYEGRVPNCDPDMRLDNRNVIFVEKHP